MGAQVQHCALINLCPLVLRGVYLGVVLDELGDSLDEVGFLDY